MTSTATGPAPLDIILTGDGRKILNAPAMRVLSHLLQNPVDAAHDRYGTAYGIPSVICLRRRQRQANKKGRPIKKAGEPIPSDGFAGHQ
jgi:hypothetical protein